MSITATLVSKNDLAQQAEAHFLRVAVFDITGLTANSANTVPYATLFPQANASWGQTTGGQLPESNGPLAIFVNALTPDGSTFMADPDLDSTNGGTVSAGAGTGWDYFTGGRKSGSLPYYGNVYLLVPASVTACQLVILY